MASDDRARGYWDRLAADYDRSMRLLGGPLPRTCELVAREVGPSDRVLEVAAGTGLFTSALQTVAREVVATDYSAAMVEQLEARGRREAWPNVVTLQRDLYALGFESGAFDVVVAANVLHLVPDLPGAIDALLHVLRPSGKLLVPTFLHAQNRVARLSSRLVGLTGFPSPRRFDERSLRAAVERQGARVEHLEVVHGVVFPIGFVCARPPVCST